MKKTLKSRILTSIKLRKDNVVMRSDYLDMASQSQLTRIFNALIKEGVLIRFGLGVYAKAEKSLISDKFIATKPLPSLACEALTKLGVSVSEGKDQQRYNNGLTTQIPVKIVLNTGKKRISRQFSIGKQVICYENNY
jgi:hypothetical protein